jgi:PAS domain S-box-containing protein
MNPPVPSPVPTQVTLPYPTGHILVSRTDLAGNITHANAALVEISGYTEEELIGQAHSIMRHPGVPDAMFQHMWKTLQRGRPWRGVIKNLCKNGDHYWADAYIVPIHQRGKIVGYMSARTEPTPAQIEQAERDYAYAAVTGRSPAAGGFNPLHYFTIKRGVLTGIFFTLAAIALCAWLGIRGMDTTARVVHELQNHADIGAHIGKSDQFAAQALATTMVALQIATDQRKPQNIAPHIATLRDIARRMNESHAAVLASEAGAHEPPERIDPLVPGHSGRDAAITSSTDAWLAASHALLAEGIVPIADLLEKGRYDDAEKHVITRVGPLMQTLNRQTELAIGALRDSANDMRKGIDGLYADTIKQLIAWTLLVLVVVGASGILFFRETMKPLKKAMQQMQKIAAGNLSEKPDVYGFGEPGKLSSTLATMQIQLMVMLDDIQHASAVVRDQVIKLNQAVIDILNCTEDQYGRALQINEALERSGADSRQLAERALQAARLAGELGENPALATPETLAQLARHTHDAAALANLNTLAAEEINRLSANIMELVADNRAAVNDSWAIGQKLDATSSELNGMLDKFS